ncbi:MAG: rhodanese-like domain-containing protein [Verrucomicrobiales bacterium]|nr:rhodanese-like domain-containing protein [Verrucomicrobiales bacterium]
MRILLLFVLSVGIASANEVKHVDAKAVVQLVSQENRPRILDVRTAKEYSDGHLPGAANIDFNRSDFEKRLAQLDKFTPYLVHCRSGSRSKKSLATFKKLGFQHIIHLDGGFKAWKKAGGTIVE